MEPLLYFVVYLAAGLQHAKRAKFHFMVPFLAMAKLERARFCAWLIESVVTCCKSCICCFSLLSRDCPREGSIHGTLVVFCCSPCSRIATREACKVPFHGTLSRHGKARASSVLHMAYRKRCNLLENLYWLFSLTQQDVLATAQTRSLDFPDELFFLSEPAQAT